MRLDRAINRMEKNLEFLYDKVSKIEQRAEEKQRPLTENEKDTIQELLAEIDSLELALDYLHEYSN